MWHSRQKKTSVIATLPDSRQTVYWCINVDSTFVYLGPLDFNKDSNNHICCGQMLYKGLVIIITASFSDCKTLGKRLRISAKFCHWNPKKSEILSKHRNSDLGGASDFHQKEGSWLTWKNWGIQIPIGESSVWWDTKILTRPVLKCFLVPNADWCWCWSFLIYAD